VMASSHIAARSLASAWFKARWEETSYYSDPGFWPESIAVVDIDAAGYGKYMGHCQGCSPNEMCSRSGTCEWCDERDTKKAAAEHFLHQEEPDDLHYFMLEMSPEYTAMMDAKYPSTLAQPSESTSVWQHIEQEELDKVHEIWCRREGDEDRYGKTKDFGIPGRFANDK